MNIFKSITGRIQKFWNRPSQQNGQPFELIKKLLLMIKNTQDVEYSCDDVNHLLDQYVEMVERGEDADELMPLIKHHLDLCPDCREEYQALRSILQAMPT